jgi:hypothetical protein
MSGGTLMHFRAKRQKKSFPLYHKWGFILKPCRLS